MLTLTRANSIGEPDPSGQLSGAECGVDARVLCPVAESCPVSSSSVLSVSEDKVNWSDAVVSDRLKNSEILSSLDGYLSHLAQPER